jgi:F0F1-type ATP synthase assembly protein I
MQQSTIPKKEPPALKGSVGHLVDNSWSGLREKPVGFLSFLLIGLGAGFCLGWFVRRYTSANQ